MKRKLKQIKNLKAMANMKQIKELERLKIGFPVLVTREEAYILIADRIEAMEEVAATKE